MRLVFKLFALIVLAGCVGPTAPPPPDFALRVIDARTVAFRATFGADDPEAALERAFTALGWEGRRAEAAGWSCGAAGLRLDCVLRDEGGGRDVILVLREPAPTASLEERGRSLARLLGARERGR